MVAVCIVIHFLAEDDMKNSPQKANKMDIKDLKLVIVCKLCDRRYGRMSNAMQFVQCVLPFFLTKLFVD